MPSSDQGGRFEGRLTLYLQDATGFREVPVSIRGVCDAPRKPRRPGDNPFAVD